jgi:hypothetical protein
MASLPSASEPPGFTADPPASDPLVNPTSLSTAGAQRPSVIDPNYSSTSRPSSMLPVPRNTKVTMRRTNILPLRASSAAAGPTSSRSKPSAKVSFGGVEEREYSPEPQSSPPSDLPTSSEGGYPGVPALREHFEPVPPRTAHGSPHIEAPKPVFSTQRESISALFGRLNKTPSPERPRVPSLDDDATLPSGREDSYALPGSFVFTPARNTSSAVRANEMSADARLADTSGRSDASRAEETFTSASEFTLQPEDSPERPRRARRVTETGADDDWFGLRPRSPTSAGPAERLAGGAPRPAPEDPRRERPAHLDPPRERTPMSALGLSALPTDLGSAPLDYLRARVSRAPSDRSAPTAPPDVRADKGKGPVVGPAVRSSPELGARRAAALEDDLGRPVLPTATASATNHKWIPIAQPDAVSPFVEALFENPEDGSPSLYDKIAVLTRRELSIHDVEDLGVPLASDRIQHLRFRLHAGLRRELELVVADMQRIVDGVSQYLSRSLFTRSAIDPGGHLLRACYGIRDLNLLSVNYRELTKRTHRAASRVENLRDLDAVYINDLSPIQTTSSWNDALEANRGAISPTQVARVYIGHPRYQLLYPASARENIQNWVDSAEHVGPAGSWPPFEEERAASRDLLNAFPPRSPEYFPKKKTYPLGSETPTYTTFARTASYGQGSHWQLPPNKTPDAFHSKKDVPDPREEFRPSDSSSARRDEEEVTRLLDPTVEESASYRRPHSAAAPRARPEARGPRPSLTTGILGAHAVPPSDRGLHGQSSSLAAALGYRSTAPAPGGGSGSGSTPPSSPGGSPRGASRGPLGLPRKNEPTSGPPWDWSSLLPPRGAGNGPPDGGPPGPGGGGGFSANQSGPSSHLYQLRLNAKVNIKDLLKWGGDYHGAVDWAFDIQRYVDMSELVAENLGYYLPGTLEKKSSAQRFYDMMPSDWKRFMTSSYLRFVWAFKEMFLTERWVVEMTHYADRQMYRQRGHESEDPLAYLGRRLRYIRVLGLADEGSPREITELLRTAPPAWKSILDMSSITAILKTAAYQFDQLDELARVGQRSSGAMSDGDLIRKLTGSGFLRDGSTSGARRPFVPRVQGSRGARLAITDGDGADGDASHAYITELEEQQDALEYPDDGRQDEVIQSDSNHDDAVGQAYVNVRKNSGSQSNSKYPFPKRDEVRTPTGQKPPSPCRHCGSAEHWNRECPTRDMHLAQMKATGNRVEVDDPVYEKAYAHSVNRASIHAYTGEKSRSALVTYKDEDLTRFADLPKAAGQDVANEYGPQIASWAHDSPESPSDEDAEAAAKEVFSIRADHLRPQLITGAGRARDDRPNDPRVEDVLDERDTPRLVFPLLGDDHIMEEVPSCDGQQPSSPESCSKPEPPLGQEESNSEKTLESSWEDIAEAHGAFGAFKENDVQGMFVLRQRRAYAPGRSAAGISVLSTTGWLGLHVEAPVDLCLDSCADVTLLSQKFYDNLKVKPRIKRGMKLKLWQLTDQSAEISGYVTIPVIMRTVDGHLLRMEAEAYLVPGMTVDVLLGEDFQKNYGISPVRDGDESSQIAFAGLDFRVGADAVGTSDDARRVRRSVLWSQKFAKAKTHRREYHKRRRESKDTDEVRAAEDCLVAAESIRNIKVKAKFGSDSARDWLVDKNALADEDGHSLLVPPTLIKAESPFLPVANPSKFPRRVKKGDVLGKITDPSSFFDTAATDADEEIMRKHAASVAAFISTRLDEEYVATHTDDPGGSGHAEAEARNARAQDTTEAETEADEQVGPKTAELPDNVVYNSSRLREVLDVGEVPAHLREKVWEMLEKRVRAFGFDDRLGKHATKVRIRVKPEQDPIAAPMYTSSPEKRRVIEEQVRKWLEMDVIEPSRSPWSAPVVIAYRNGKARFCVDYRRLNAATIADEFPIPRQSDIMAALAGSQVLSTLDALSGFLQLEVHPDDVEKTAFRTHLGLYNFLRMPFGLRNGPAIFQHVMQEILSPFLWIFCLVYIDNIVVYSKTHEDHLAHLDQVLEAIEKAGITLSPKKCHLFYSSLLLLGHKVSRFGLSTHQEKVQAILELAPPKRVSDLQTFLGMVVYFSTFIPYYASIARPLFQLLRKGCVWRWGEDEQHAFEAAKEALRSSPVLGHPTQGLPYRLYTDASDEALGCALQQIQQIRVGDLKGTRAYDRLAKAHAAGEPPPKLTISVSQRVNDAPADDVWGADLDSSLVRVERVIVYWSRTFKGAETRYSATKREALGAKEGLVKFLPFIEGEQVLLVTDHAALQWAKTYENTNKRLANWGRVFSAFPGLQVVHRAGRVHSNVDPLSRLPRQPPLHVSPAADNSPSIALEYDSEDGTALEKNITSGVRVNAFTTAARASEEGRPRRERRAPVRTTFSIPGRDVPTKPRRPTKRRVLEPDGVEVRPPERADASNGPEPTETAPPEQTHASDGTEPHAGREPSEESRPAVRETHIPEWEFERELPHLLVKFSDTERRSWVEAYSEDPALKSRWMSDDADSKSWRPGRRYIRDVDGLLYFRDADHIPRLCVPKSKIPLVLQEGHDSAFETAHAGPKALWRRLRETYFWPRMSKDIDLYCASCDVCQKTKHRNFKSYGYLRPQDIPSAPYESISLDLIGPLSLSDDQFSAVLVVVDRLTKHAQFIPTVMELNAEGFAYLVYRHVICRFGLPRSIYADRDGRWLSDFWMAISSYLKSKMILSSARHPQHDGQTEIINQRLEIMLRAYVSQDLSTWARWLPALEHAYNSLVSSSTRYAPNQLLYGFVPLGPLDLANPRSKRMQLLRQNDGQIDGFLRDIETHRDMARLAIAEAQEKQAHAYDAGRRARTFGKGERVLVNPHSLEWLESKGKTAKLRQRWIGPFDVIERVSVNSYRLKLPRAFAGSNVINLQHLKPYVSSPPTFGNRPTLPNTRLHLQEGEEPEVEDILAHRWDRMRQTIVYLVRFKGYSSMADKWLSTRDLRDVAGLLRAYQIKNNL